MLRRVCASMAGMGQLRLPQPVQRCVPLLPLYPRIADQVDAQVKVIGLVPQAGICSDFGVPTGPIYLRKSINRQRLFSARKRHESVAVRHFHFSQRLRVHRVVVIDDAVEVQDISDDRVKLVVG